MLNARKTADALMSGETVDAAHFREIIWPLVAQRSQRNPSAPVRAYGEMVNLLWREGNRAGAIQLESLWNELSAAHSLELLCGYSMSNFASADDAAQFEEICAQHTHVVPTEGFSRVRKSGRMLEITRLQQRALALENEVARREALERELREALEERERSLAAERAARAEAESANRAKNQFLAVMSHELRTPLNAIAGHTQLLELGLHGPITAAQHDALDRIERSQRHLLSLVDNVLNLAHIESGRAEYSLDEVDLDSTLQSIIAMIEPLLTSAQLTCRIEARSSESGAPPMRAYANAEKVQQILLNLLTNAIKFTPPGGQIAIAMSRSSAENMVCMEVSDTGVGIPPAKIDSVFQPFVQLATKLSSRSGGIGLGLTISRQFARGMRGDLTAASDVGTNGISKGARFRLTLPMAQPPG